MNTWDSIIVGVVVGVTWAVTGKIIDGLAARWRLRKVSKAYDTARETEWQKRQESPPLPPKQKPRPSRGIGSANL